MKQSGLHQYDEALHAAKVWLKELMEILGWTEPTHAHNALKTVLHEIRDRLPVPLAANFSSQMPLIIRGLFYEGWSPGSERERDRSPDSFLEPVEHAFRNVPDIEARTVVIAVFRILNAHISPGEIDNVLQALPRQIRDLSKVSFRTSPISGL
jgi:uncharacterized protein (DUF2267 family)